MVMETQLCSITGFVIAGPLARPPQCSLEDSLFVRLHTLVQFDDMAADKPDQVAEIRDGRLVSDIVQHVLVVHCGDKGSASGSGLAFAPRPPEKWEHTLTHT